MNDVQTLYFEFQDEKSSKFWEVTKSKELVTVRYGKLGTTGQTIAKEFQDEGEAIKHVEKLIAEKLKKGYQGQVQTSDKPSNPKNKINSESFSKKSISGLQKYSESLTKDDEKKYVAKFATLSQPFCAAQFLPFDKTNQDHRLSDQIIRGFPFTSSSWPWPTSDIGRPMQPLAQIDLKKAGDLLKIELGSGLLQVWTYKTQQPLLRIVPVAALDEIVDSYFPDDEPWNVECDDEDEDIVLFYLYLSQMRHPRIEWRSAGQMFPNPMRSMSDWCEENTKLTERKQEQLSERLEALDIPMMEGGDKAFKWVHLGGFPGGLGNEGARCDWSGEKEKLLLYVRDGYEDVVFTLQVTVVPGTEGNPAFKAYITCDN